jgi:hypothetical protein
MAGKALVVVVDVTEDEAQAKIRGALTSSRHVSHHHVPSDKVRALRSVLRRAELEGPPPLPSAAASPRVGKGRVCAGMWARSTSRLSPW